MNIPHNPYKDWNPFSPYNYCPCCGKPTTYPQQPQLTYKPGDSWIKTSKNEFGTQDFNDYTNISEIMNDEDKTKF